jgi:hypothetical protein
MLLVMFGEGNNLAGLQRRVYESVSSPDAADASWSPTGLLPRRAAAKAEKTSRKRA